MHIQIRYIRLLSYILEIDSLTVIKKYGKRYSELYYSKHDYQSSK